MQKSIKELNPNNFYGVLGTTNIGIIRDRIEDNMYMTIEDLESSKKYNIFGADNELDFLDLNSIKIEKSENRIQTYVFVFSNDCSIGKRSFGTEEQIIATLNCPILKLDGTETRLEYLRYGEEVLSIKRCIYSKEISKCKSKLIYSFKYYDEYVYNIKFVGGYKYFCSNGLFIGSI